MLKKETLLVKDENKLIEKFKAKNITYYLYGINSSPRSSLARIILMMLGYSYAQLGEYYGLPTVSIELRSLQKISYKKFYQ